MTVIPPEPDDFEPVPPDEARRRIMAAIVERLGAQWNNESDGWLMVHDSAYLVRLNRGDRDIDFQCDLLGEIIITEQEASPLRISGKMIAWMVLAASLFVALALAQTAGMLQ